MMGSESRLHVYTEDGTRLIARVPTLNLTADERKSLVFGKQPYIAFTGRVMRFFHPDTTRNLLA